MNVSISDPDLQRFIAEQIQTGDFQSAEEVVLAALMIFRDQRSFDEGELDDDTVADLLESFAQADRGEVMTSEQIAAGLGIERRRKAGQSGAA